jgi:hypothetical protein
LPLTYAPETLPHQIVENREMQKYIEKAQQTKNKSKSD